MELNRAFMASALSLAAAATLTCGCGPEKIPGLTPVEGVVMYEGIPLPYASMTFAPVLKEGEPRTGVRVSTAMTDSRGRFVVSTLGRVGALPGEYAVTVEKYIPNGPDAVEAWEKARRKPGYSEPRPADVYDDGKPQVDEKGNPVETVAATFDVTSAIPTSYSEKETSGLTAEVPEKGVKDLKFELVK